MKPRIYKLAWDEDPDQPAEWGDRIAVIVIATTEAAARQLAAKHDGDNALWLDREAVSAEMLGEASASARKLYGVATGADAEPPTGLVLDAVFYE